MLMEIITHTPFLNSDFSHTLSTLYPECGTSSTQSVEIQGFLTLQ